MYRCRWFIPNVCGSYQMSGFLTRCQGFLPNVWGSPQSELIPHRSRRKMPLMRGWCSIQTACILTMKRGISDKKNHCNVTIIPEISSVKCRMACVLYLYFISPHDSRQNRNVFNYKNRCLTDLDYAIKNHV